MQSSGHRFRDVEHHPLLAENDSYDSSSSSEADMADRVWFIRDGCGMVCAVMTWLLVAYADFVVTFVMLLPSKDFWYSLLNGILFNCLAVLALSSHLRTMLTDPVSTSAPLRRASRLAPVESERSWQAESLLRCSEGGGRPGAGEYKERRGSPSSEGLQKWSREQREGSKQRKGTCASPQ